jgi:hypothetical protein
VRFVKPQLLNTDCCCRSHVNRIATREDNEKLFGRFDAIR